MVSPTVAVGLAFLAMGATLLLLLREPLRHPGKPGSTGFVLAIVGVSLWPMAIGASYVLPGAELSVAAWSVRLLAASLISASWFLVAFDFTRDRSPGWRLLAPVAGYLFVEVTLVATNDVHHYVLGLDTALHAGILDPDYGPWFWVQATINYALILGGTVLLVVEWARSTGLRRKQSAVLSAAVVPPILTNLVTIFGIVDTPHDLTPFGLVGSGVLLSWALYRVEFLNVVPIARQTAMAEMRDAVVTLDDDDRVVDCNAAARDLFDEGDDYVGKPALEFFSAVSTAAVRRIEDLTDVDTQLSMRLNDDERHFDLSISPVRVDGGAELGRVVVLRDVTDRKRREQQLLEQNARLDEFAQVISHDLQGPLMVITCDTELAKTTGDLEHLDHVLDAAERIDHLVDDLLGLARRGARLDGLEPVSLADVAEAAWMPGHVSARLDIESDRSFLADRDRLLQLLENLFRNAVEHAGPDVRVTVGGLPDGFFVADDGPGIPAEDRDRVFEQGYTSTDGGTGLGLGIVDHIARAHGWHVSVSEEETGGARFEVTGVEGVDGGESDDIE